jgi:hypothetical protein
VHIARMVEKRKICRYIYIYIYIYVGIYGRKPEGKSPLGRPRRRCVNSIKMYVGRIGWSDVLLAFENENTAVKIRRADYAAPPYPQKLALTSTTSGAHSVRIVRLRTKITEL